MCYQNLNIQYSTNLKYSTKFSSEKQSILNFFFFLKSTSPNLWNFQLLYSSDHWQYHQGALVLLLTHKWCSWSHRGPSCDLLFFLPRELWFHRAGISLSVYWIINPRPIIPAWITNQCHIVITENIFENAVAKYWLLLIYKTNLNLYFIMYMAFLVITSNAYDVNKKLCVK